MVNEVNGTSQSVIQSLGHNQKSEQVNSQDNPAKSRSSATDTPSTSTDVSLSTTGELINRLEAQVKSEPVVDTQRVNQIRAAILDGTYQVDSNRIADKFMQFESMMTQSQGSEEV